MGKITREFKLSHGDNTKHYFTCRECSRKTIHSIVAAFKESGSEDCGGGNSVDWDNDNQIIQCLGCETVSFRTVSTCSEDAEHDIDGNAYYPESITYYPGRSEGIASIETYLLPSKVQEIYKETTFAIENNQYVLAGIGIRAIVETICKKLNVKGTDLFAKINTLKDQSIVTPEETKILHKLRILGNKSAHEVTAHNSQQLSLAMKIIKHMIDGVYIIPNQVKQAFSDPD